MPAQKRLKTEYDDAPSSKRVKSEADDSQVPTPAQTIPPTSAKITTATQPTIKPEPNNNVTIKTEPNDSTTSSLTTIPEQARLTEDQAMEALGLLSRHYRVRIKMTNMDPKSREWLAAQAEMMLAQSNNHIIRSGYEIFKAKELKEDAYKYALKAMQAPSITSQEYRARLEREMEEESEKWRKKRAEERAQREKEDQKRVKEEQEAKSEGL